MIRNALVMLFAVALMSSPVLAGGGGGGAKRDATIRVQNDLDWPYGAAVGLTNAQLNAIVNANDPVAEWTKLGGKVLQPGEHADFKVRSGSNRVTVAGVDPNTGDLFLVFDGNRSVGRNQTLTILTSSL